MQMKGNGRSTGIYRTVAERIPDDPDAQAQWLCERVMDTRLDAHLGRAEELAKRILALEEAGTLEAELARVTLPRQQETVVRPIARAMTEEARSLLKAIESLR